MGETVTMTGQHAPFVKVKEESGSEIVHYSILYEHFPEEFKQVAEKQLNETEGNRELGLQRMKEYMQEENLPCLKDELILAVLRNCKYDLKKSKIKLRKFTNTYKEIIKELAEMDMDKIEQIIDDKPVGFLPYRDKLGRIILYTRPCGMNLELYEVADFVTIARAQVLFLLNHSLTSVTGFVYYGDCRFPSLYAICPILNGIRRNIFRILSLPIRVPIFELLHENYLCRCFIRLVMPLLSKKMVGRFSFRGSNLEDFYKDYHPDILPEEYGGNMGPLSSKSYKEKLLDFIKKLINENA